jgi:acetyl esterase/lipase
MATAGTSAVEDSPAISPKHSLWQRFIFTIRLRLFKALVTTVFKIWNLPGIRNKSIQPTFTKIYPGQPTLTNRVFLPKSYKSDGPLLPLYLDIHGGGFALGSPVVDDPFCSNFANDNKVIVISLDYPKSPSCPYPAAVQALTKLVKAVLEDETLPFDKEKVAVGGFSAGANLSIAITQNEFLRERIGAVVAYYPPTGTFPRCFHFLFHHILQGLRVIYLEDVVFGPKRCLRTHWICLASLCCRYLRNR